MGDYDVFGKNHNFDGLFGPRDPETSQEDMEEVREENEPCVPEKVDSEDKQEKYKLYHSVKFTREEEEMFQQIMSALNTTNDSRVIRWCLGEAYSANMEKIKRIIKKKRNIETL